MSGHKNNVRGYLKMSNNTPTNGNNSNSKTSLTNRARSVLALNGKNTTRRIDTYNWLAIFLLLGVSIYALTNFHKENRDALGYHWVLSLSIALLYLFLFSKFPPLSPRGESGGRLLMTVALMILLLTVTIIPVFTFVKGRASEDGIRAGQTLEREAERDLGIAGITSSIVLAVIKLFSS